MLPSGIWSACLYDLLKQKHVCSFLGSLSALLSIQTRQAIFPVTDNLHNVMPIQLPHFSVWARTTKRGVSLPVSGQRLTVFFGKLIMSRTQNDVITVWIL